MVFFEMAWSDSPPEHYRWTSDLEYEVHLTKATLRHFMTQLTPCPTSSTSFTSSIIFAFRSLILPFVWAGHGDDGDVSLVESFEIEDLLQGTRFLLGNAVVSEEPYCFAFWSVSGVSDSISPHQATLVMEGIWRKKGSEETENEEVPFQIESSLNWGIQKSLISKEGNRSEFVYLSERVSRVTWVRHYATLFNGVDFETQSPRSQARQVFKNLIESAFVQFESR